MPQTFSITRGMSESNYQVVPGQIVPCSLVGPVLGEGSTEREAIGKAARQVARDVREAQRELDGRTLLLTELRINIKIRRRHARTNSGTESI